MSAAIKLARISSQGGIGTGRLVRRGDPGLFGTLGKIAGGAIGLITGGPAGAVAGWSTGGAIGSALEGGSKPKPAVATPGFAPTTSYPVVGSPGVTGALQRLVPGGATGYQVNAPAAAANGAGCPKGHRLNKSGYWLKSGEYVAPGTRCVKSRRRNPANPRALDRAIGRLNSAKRLQHKLSGFSTRKYSKSGAVNKHWSRTA
ncbi:MAG: hypothetical protein P8099_19970 [Gemmatimonadota bacterium]